MDDDYVHRPRKPKIARGAPRYDAKRGWIGGDSRTLYAFVDSFANQLYVCPGGGPNKKLTCGIGPSVDEVRVATKAEATRLWQDPLHSGWKTLGRARTRRRRR